MSQTSRSLFDRLLGRKRVESASVSVAPAATQGTILGFYGHHKCGTNWILQVMTDVCAAEGLTLVNHDEAVWFHNGDILAYRREHPFDFWSYTNADYTFVRPLDTIGFHVVRDPRDVIVSGYFSHLATHPDTAWPRLRYYRPYLQTLDKHDGLMCEMEFSGIYLQQMLLWEYGAKTSILELRFEDMIAQPVASFERVLTHMGFMPARVSRLMLEEILERHSFKNLSGGRAPGEEDATSHYRRGQPGDWRNHLDAEHIAYFKSLYNPLLLKLGYETREDW